MNHLLQKLLLGCSSAAVVAGSSLSSAFAQGDIEQVVVSASRITIAGYTQPTPVTVVGAAQLEKDAFANITDAIRELPQVSAPPSSYSTNAGGGGPGTAGENLLNLRNLGNTRTLVLFDGQRVVASNISGGVDIGTLPSALIQRVDVVTGGASAAWGSDAVAGVVNFILNKNFTGFKATVQAGEAYNGLNRSVSAQAAWGDDIFGGRGHFAVAASMNMSPDATPVINENWFRGIYWVSNPAYTAGSSLPQLIIANDVGLAVATAGGLITSSPKGTVAAANALRGIEFVTGGQPQLVNFGNVSLGSLSNGGSLTPRDSDTILELAALPSRSYNFFGFVRYKLTDTIQASLQLNYGTNFSKSRTSSSTQTAVVIQSDNAFIPSSVRSAMQTGGITSFTMGYFAEDPFNNYAITSSNYIPMAEGSLGPTVLYNGREVMRGVLSLDGTIGDQWSWNAYYEHSTSNIYIHSPNNNVSANIVAAEDAVTVTTANRGTSGLPLGSIVCRSTLPGQTAVAGAQPGCIPLDAFGYGVVSPNAIRYISGNSAGTPDFYDMLLNQDVAEASVQGTAPWELPAGKIALAFGAGYRREQNRGLATSIGAQAGYAVANYSPFPSTSYTIWEGFAELDAPILKNNIVNSLDFSMAGRLTDYSTSGMVETWKLGLTSQVNDSIRLRTTWSVDIRAPILAELFSPGANNGTTAKDPKSHATVSIKTTTTGNPALTPEVARTISGGIVLTPTFIEGLSFSADWYSINLTNQIASVGNGTILNQCDPTLPSIIHPGQNGDINDPLCTHLIFDGPGGALSFIVNSPINFASLTTSGLDLQANYTMDFWEGNVAWSAIANLNDESTQSQPGTPTNDGAGSGGNPKWKGIVSADYTTGPYSITVQGRWYGTNKYSNTANTGNLSSATLANLYDPNGFELPFVAYLDLRGSYKWNDNIQIYGAIDNATNVPPAMFPSVAGNVKAQGSLTTTVPGTYDMLGRYFRVGVRFNY